MDPDFGQGNRFSLQRTRMDEEKLCVCVCLAVCEWKTFCACSAKLGGKTAGLRIHLWLLTDEMGRV